MYSATIRSAGVAMAIVVIGTGSTFGRAEEPRGPWRAFGRVTDRDGKPMAGVEVWAHCGMGTL